MKDKNRWGFLIAVLLIVGLLTNTRTVFALGTPQIASISPGSPSPVGTNVSIRATVAWDNEFRSMRICFRDTNWCQEDGSPDITKSFDTSGLGAGTYTILVQVSKQGEGWDSATSTSTSYELTSHQEQQPIEPPAPSEPPRGPNISVFDFNPWSATVGDSVNIHIRVDSNNPGATKFDMPCGGISKFETSEREFDSTWNTGGCGAEEVTIRVCSRDVNDQNWQNPSCSSKNYTLSSAQNSAPIPTAKFWADATAIKNGDCTYLHWETSNANNVEIDGVSIANSDKMQVCPTVTKHYSLSAKNDAGDASRSLTIVVGSTSSGSNNSNWSQQGPTGMNGNCPKAPAQLKPGDIAIIVRTDLNLRPQPGVDNTPIRIMPMLSYVTIISGPTCTVGSRWFEVGFEGSDGWAAEVGSKGEYHMIPNGQPLPGSDSTQNDSSKKVDQESGSGEKGIIIEPPTTGIIQIGADIYVIIKGHRRLVPNPETLDALGINRNMIDNMGWSDEDLKAYPKELDIPDVNRDHSKFQEFKKEFDLFVAPNYSVNMNPSISETPKVPMQSGTTPDLSGETLPTNQIQPSNNLICDILPLFCPKDTLAGDIYPRAAFNDGDQSITQCTEYVQTKRPDVLCWIQQHANAGVWADKIDPNQAKVFGITVDNNPRINDIAVWNGNCGMGSAGHVAYVQAVKLSINTIQVFDANRLINGVLDGQIHEDYHEYTIQPDCLKFIHQPTVKIDYKTCSVIVQPTQPKNPSLWDWVKSIFEK